MPSKLPTPAQTPLIQLFSSYVYLTTSRLVSLNARHPKAIQRDFRDLEKNGYLRSVPHPTERFGENIWFLTQKGWNFALDQGWVEKKVEATDEKSNKNIPHDLVLTDLHLRLHEFYGSELYWTQLHQDCYRRFGKAENDRVNSDAFFSFPVKDGFSCFFVEVENTGESKYKNGKSSRVLKMEAYVAYSQGHFQKEYDGDDFRVMTLLPTPEGVGRFLGKLHDLGGNVATRRFWSTDYGSISKLTKDADVFTTPKDIEWEAARRRWSAQRYHSLSAA